MKDIMMMDIVNPLRRPGEPKTEQGKTEQGKIQHISSKE